MKALIAMSGGVDSSAAALIMQKKGYECTGVTMRLYREAEADRQAAEREIGDAADVCGRLSIPHLVMDLGNAFQQTVIDDFVRVYESGGTPNPCVLCNRCLKFGRLLEEAERLGLDCIATGHYARIEQDEKSGRYLIRKAKDLSKDQSYVLYSLSQEQLSKAQFPLGEYTKEEARALAASEGFTNASKGDSQDICFIPDGDYASFIERYTGKAYPEGDFIDGAGNVLGRHEGMIRYTIGQRRGLKIASSARLYVTDKNVEANTVTLSFGEDLFYKTVYLSDYNLIQVSEIREPMRVKAKLRYRHTEQPAWLSMDGEYLRLDFDEPQRAPTKGQSAVIYDGEYVVGGGLIVRVER